MWNTIHWKVDANQPSCAPYLDTLKAFDGFFSLFRLLYYIIWSCNENIRDVGTFTVNMPNHWMTQIFDRIVRQKKIIHVYCVYLLIDCFIINNFPNYNVYQKVLFGYCKDVWCVLSDVTRSLRKLLAFILNCYNVPQTPFKDFLVFFLFPGECWPLPQYVGSH